MFHKRFALTIQILGKLVKIGLYYFHLFKSGKNIQLSMILEFLMFKASVSK